MNSPVHKFIPLMSLSVLLFVAFCTRPSAASCLCRQRPYQPLLPPLPARPAFIGTPSIARPCSTGPVVLPAPALPQQTVQRVLVERPVEQTRVIRVQQPSYQIVQAPVQQERRRIVVERPVEQTPVIEVQQPTYEIVQAPVQEERQLVSVVQSVAPPKTT